MSLLLPPPTPGSNSRDYSKDDDSDSDVSEDSAGLLENKKMNVEKNVPFPGNEFCSQNNYFQMVLSCISFMLDLICVYQNPAQN